jgi:hypothetical protein
LALRVVFGAEFFELCPHRRKPALEDTNDLTADLGRREGGSVYKPTPAIDLILRPDETSSALRYTAIRRLVSSICCLRSSTVMA